MEVEMRRLEGVIRPAHVKLLLAQMGGREVCGLVEGSHGVFGPDQAPNPCTRLRLWLLWACARG